MRLPREQAARKEGLTQEGPWKGRDLSSDEDLVSEATPETVRQDRGAGDPRVAQLTNTGNQVSAQMGLLIHTDSRTVVMEVDTR